jgi:hypothetical protein
VLEGVFAPPFEANRSREQNTTSAIPSELASSLPRRCRPEDFFLQKEGSVDSDYVRRAMADTEISEWFDWLRRELPLGGVRLPEEETAVWVINRAIHTAYRAQGVYGHLPEPLRSRLVRALIVYECWERQRNLRERARVPGRLDLLPAVTATAHLRPLGRSGRHQVLEANDGFRYAVTIPTGLWTEQLSATEVICTELARLMGLTVPRSAVVAVGPELLRNADLCLPEWARPRERLAPRHCCGFRYIEADEGSGRFPLGRGRDRDELLGRVLFDCWVANFRPGRFVFRYDESVGQSRIVFYDHSMCLAGSRWALFTGRDHHVCVCPRVKLDARDEAAMLRWVGRIRKLDMNPLWDLIFDIPAGWYGHRKMEVCSLLDELSLRRSFLRGDVEFLMGGASEGRQPGKVPCRSEDGCPSGLACKLPVVGGGVLGLGAVS